MEARDFCIGMRVKEESTGRLGYVEGHEGRGTGKECVVVLWDDHPEYALPLDPKTIQRVIRRME